MKKHAATYLSKAFIIAAALACVSVPTQAATVAINPSDDASLYTCAGCNILNNSGYIMVGNYMQGGVKFSTSAISGSITQAFLSVNPYSLTPAIPQIDVYGFTSSSGLITATDVNTGIFIGSWDLPSNLGHGQDAFFDVTSFLSNTNAPYVGFNLRAAPSADVSSAGVFSSIEFNLGHPSQLTVSTVPIPGAIFLFMSGLLGLFGVLKRKIPGA